MLTKTEIISYGNKINASDILITVGVPVVYRCNGIFEYYDKEIVNSEYSYKIAEELLGKDKNKLLEEKELDFANRDNGYNYRVNIYHQKGNVAIAIRILNNAIKNIGELGLPSVVTELCNKKSGLILITGPTGSGKSTTMAAMINYINNHFVRHIITVEDPIEYIFEHNKSIICQKQVGIDTESFNTALRPILREDPDVIVIGEMRDNETIKTALTCAETGHLVISTLHTINAANTIDRIIDVFPDGQQQQIRTQLSMVLEGIICQRLIPKNDNTGRVLACEVAVINSAIRNLIRTGRGHLISSQISLSMSQGMITLEKSIENLVKSGIISEDYNK